MSARRTLPAAALALVAIVATGCENPFDPKADLRLIRWDANAGMTAQFTQSKASTTAMSDIWGQRARMYIGNFGSVGVLLTSYVVVYRQIGAQDAPVNLPPGSPIPSLGGAAGRRYSMVHHVQGRENNSAVYAGPEEIWVRAITREFLSYVATNPGTVNGGIDCEVEIYGSDHNGHDIKVGGVLHVEIF